MNKLQLYELLVNRVPGIRDRYNNKREKLGSKGRICAWIYLVALNFSYYALGNRKLNMHEKYPYYEEKKLPVQESESSLSCKKSPAEFAAELSAFDVISFDVFDTLIFRPFSRPSDLFYVLGNRLNYPDFRNIRIKCEKQARKIKMRDEECNEVSIDEIYTVLKNEAGISGSTGASPYEEELSLELEACFANPYMLEVVSLLKAAGKRIIITSDMYLKEKHFRMLLENAGYPAFDAYYISCENGRSKSKGDLYDLVRESELSAAGAMNLSFAHVGDNTVSDIKHAKAHGFTAFYYENVNYAGKGFRPEDMSEITGSVYRGLVNTHIHSGLKKYSREYEYGFIYGGLFVTGYCMFIHDYVKKNSIDEILFLSRDGDILKKVYNLLYPEENNAEYVLWSRLAAAKLTAPHFKYDYFRRFLYHKINQNITLESALASMELTNMLEPVCEVTSLTPESVLTEEIADAVKDYLIRNWDVVISAYDEQVEAAGQYYKQVLDGTHSAAAVDIGWAGSGAITLDYMVNEVWNLDCKITGIVAGTNTCANSEPDFSETYLQSGKIVSYMYSQRENRDIWKFHDPGKSHNLYLETLLDAPCGSLKGFYLDAAGNTVATFKQDNNDEDKILEIQRGILDFAAQWKKISPMLGSLNYISGRDAYAPFLIMESNKNKGFMKNIAGLMDEAGI